MSFMSVAVSANRALELPASASVEKIGQRRFRTGLILVAEQATASGYVADPGLGPL